MDKPTIGTDICMCSVCKKMFNSTYAFDKHRIGTFRPNTRRCMTTGEMREAGMGENWRGRWVSTLGNDLA